MLGAFYVDTARFVEAEREFLRALDVEKDNVIALVLIGKLQLKAGKNAEAEKTFRRVSDLPNKQYKTLYAMYLLQADKRDLAIQEFERIAAANPQDRTLRRQLLSAYMFVGKTTEAERTLNSALKTNAKDTDALLARSKLSFANGKYTEARNDVNRVIGFEPNSAEAHYLLARLHEVHGNEQSQRQELSEAIRLNPRLLPARIELSRLLTPTNPKAAIELINEAPESQRRDPAAIAQRNWALLASRDKAAAAAGVAQAITIARTPDILLQDAVVKLQRNDITGARLSLEESLSKFPQEVRALELLAQTYVMQKQPSVATRKIRDHAVAHPKMAAVQQFLGSWLERSASPAEAKSAFLSAKAADSSFWQADLSLAALDITDNKLEMARESLTPLLAHPKAGMRARLLLAAAEEKGGDRVAALGHYRKVLDEQPDNLFALNNLAYGLAEYANSPDEALPIATRAKELAPDNAAIDDTLGWIYYKKGLYSNAVQYLETSVKRDANASRRVHLAIAYAKRGDTQRALEQLTEAMKLDPMLPEIVTAQKLLAGR